MNQILYGDCRETLRQLPDGCAQCCVTSPPYWRLRDYGGGDRQIGLEASPELYVEALVGVFREVRRVLCDDGTLWLNVGDSYACESDGTVRRDNKGRTIKKVHNADRLAKASKRVAGLRRKDMIGIPWRLAFALQADGWLLRSPIIWEKRCPVPESVLDRPTRSYEHVFLLAKGDRYLYNADAIRDPAVTGGTRNMRDVVLLPTQPLRLPEHLAALGLNCTPMPSELVALCIRAGSRPGSLILNPFLGCGTTALVAEREARSWVGCELNEAFAPVIKWRLRQTGFVWPAEAST